MGDLGPDKTQNSTLSDFLILVSFVGGVFEQLARYTMRYQEADLHLLTTSAYSTSPYFSYSN